MTTSISTGWGELSTSLVSPCGADEEDDSEFGTAETSSSSNNLAASLAVKFYAFCFTFQLMYVYYCILFGLLLIHNFLVI